MNPSHLAALSAVLLLFFGCKAQQTPIAQETPEYIEVNVENELALEWEKPKLMVGIVVDQFRYDYLDRYWDDLGEDGFKRLLGEGFYLRDHHFGYAPTYTGPGHASVYTGTTPALHGIVANNWYIRDTNTEVYCAQDDEAKGIGVEGYDGKMSPRRMLSTTITDQLRIHSNMRAKVIGVSLKDRGAILPAGHLANAAYWFVGKDLGQWVTSDYYMQERPDWVNQFNGLGLPSSYLKEGWSLLNRASSYEESLPDNNPYEANYEGLIRPVFPYALDTIGSETNRFELVKASPLGNRLLTDFALAAIDGEEMGQDEITDFLCVSYSSTDYVGHQFGTMAIETQDTYLRLDLQIARLIDGLNERVGEGNYTLFLTADHGAATNPAFLKSMKAPADYYSQSKIAEALEAGLSKMYGAGDYIASLSNDQVFLNLNTLEKKKLKRADLELVVAELALKENGVLMALTRSQLLNNTFSEGPQQIIQHGFSQKSSGDVVLIMNPGWISYGPQGTTHGSAFAYDTHVPLIFYGANIPHGQSYERTYIQDVAPTVAALLRIQMPNATTGKPIQTVLQAR